MESQGVWNNHNILENYNSQKTHAQNISFKTYDKVTVIKTVWYLQKKRHVEQWERTDSPEINLYIYSQVIFAKMPTQLNGKPRVSSTNGVM